MDNNEYLTAVKKTKSEYTAETKARFTDPAIIAELAILLRRSSAVGDSVESVKKTIIYGKHYQPSGRVMGPDTAARILHPATMQLLHGLMGLIGENAELVDNLSNHLFHGTRLDQVNLAEELGDLLWYMTIMIDALGISMEQVQEMNIRKLQLRYSSGRYSDAEALKRDLPAERRVLESADE